MMRIYRELEQGTPEWFITRLGIPTASMYSAILANGRGGEPSKTRQTYMYKLAGEVLTGEPSEQFQNRHTQRGHEHEPFARNAYSFLTGNDPETIGFIRNGNTGASPDALIETDGLLEIKSKLPHLHIEGLERDEVPSEHLPQVQGQLWVAEREWCDFVSYCPKIKLFHKRVYRDEQLIRTIATEVDRFNAELAEVVERHKQVSVEF